MLLAITLLAMLFFSLPVISSEYLRGWDAPTHIFFSSGYVNSWWDTWEARWYGGYSKLSYPPLSHQLVAIVANLIDDLKLAYQFTAWAFLSIGPLAVYSFSRSFVGERSSIVAALLFVFLPSVRSMLFVFGHFAGLVGLIFMLLAVGTVSDFLRTGKKSTGLAAACFAGCSAAAHHNTAIFLLLPVLLLTTVAQFQRREYLLKSFVMRLVMIWTLCALVILMVILPFWLWLLDFRMQVPIPHASRENFLQNPDVAQIFFFDIYGPYLLIIPFALAWSIQNRSRISLAVTFVIFMILGLGGTTSLPVLLYGKEWQWLTFERFSIWATVLLLPLVGEFIAKVKSLTLFYTATFISTLLVFSTLSWLIDPSPQRITFPPVELDPVLKSFNDYPLCSKRYLALGFSYQLPDFSTYTGADTLDGLWHTARSDPLLRNSGIGSLNDALYWQNGQDILTAFLNRQDPVPAYCIYVNGASAQAQKYQKIIGEQGWKQKETFDNKVSLWVNKQISPQMMKQPQLSSPAHQFYGYLWGILPLFCLFLAIVMKAIGWLNREATR
jgi:hypothetical protein